MAPMRGERGGSPARGARASLPLPRRLIRQIARHVASSGRSLRRLEVSGRIIDNFDDIDGASDESDFEAQQPAVACGGNAGNLPPAEHDDDLTSLSWLQDRNLLRGINLTKGDMEDSKMISSQVIVNTEAKTPPPVVRIPSPPRTPCKAPPSPVSTTTHTKPPYSFSCLIFMAIEAAPARALPVKEIYAWIVRHFPYFRHAPQGWKNSVRHNLSLNKCFHKVAAAPGLGKGSLWTVDPQHRSTLIQAFGRQPLPQVEPEPVTVSVDVAVGTDTDMDMRDACVPDADVRNGCADVRNGCADVRNGCADVRNGCADVRNGCSDADVRNGCTDADVRNGCADGKNAPDPVLFPYLARRLAADTRSEPGADEYLAAATVLAMKYGPAVLDQLPPAAHLVISRCARDEHSYSGGEERRTAEALLHLAGLPPRCS